MTLPERVDVLVIGFGAAGASAAVEAHDAGASVAIVEKTPAGGGNCRYSGGFLFDDEDAVAIDHLDALCFGTTERETLAAFARGLHEIPSWIESLGGRLEAVDLGAFAGMLPSWPHFPGGARARYRQYAPADRSRPGEGLWRLLDGAVRRRRIPVLLNCAAEDLIIEAGGVSGAVVRTPDGRRAIRARAGTILASGSFEYDEERRHAYLPLRTVPVGHAGNTGDTLTLAAQAGAALWHMSAFFGWFAFLHPDHGAAFTLDVHAPSFVYVDGDGRRFADETGWEVHDKVRSATAYMPRRGNRPSMPGHIVFDEAARRAGPLHGIVGTPNDYAWSADNSTEVANGWIARGETAADLARAAGIDAGTLTHTLQSYTAAVRAGRDDEFGRAPLTLAALEPPLYAIRMWPGLATASGGPKRDARARVLRWGRSPVPRLFAAGAAGSVWGHLTEHGGGLGDAIAFGRIAGREASAGRGRAHPDG